MGLCLRRNYLFIVWLLVTRSIPPRAFLSGSPNPSAPGATPTVLSPWRDVCCNGFRFYPEGATCFDFCEKIQKPGCSPYPGVYSMFIFSSRVYIRLYVRLMQPLAVLLCCCRIYGLHAFATSLANTGMCGAARERQPAVAAKTAPSSYRRTVVLANPVYTFLTRASGYHMLRLYMWMGIVYGDEMLRCGRKGYALRMTSTLPAVAHRFQFRLVFLLATKEFLGLRVNLEIREASLGKESGAFAATLCHTD